MNLIITGTIGLDDIETPFGKVAGTLGGSGVYAALAASYFASPRLGSRRGKPGLVSIAGGDLSKEHLKTLNRVDTTGVAKAGKTFHWSGFYEFDMNEAQTKKTDLNSLAGYEPVVPDKYKKAKYLFLANIDPEIQLEVLSQMKSKPFVVLDTMNYWITSKKEILKSVIAKVDILVMNEGEARQFCGTPNLIKAGRQLLELGPNYVIIKKGEHGALLFGHSTFFSAPGYPLEEVKDPTGAGDSFAGGLIGYLARQHVSQSAGKPVSFEEIRRGIIYGSVVASFCAEEFGLKYLENISQAEIDERYEFMNKIREF
ncbi:MAG: PfkB family carbohydrate kinase [bacterium]|nr:PfkB family carbohydrate kinase [bacterium]